MNRLLHVVGYAIRGGCERCCEVFIRHSPELDHQVIVLGEPGPMSAIWGELGADVVHLDLLRFGWVSFHLRLKAAIGRLEFDRVILWAGIRVPLVLPALARGNQPMVVHAGNPFAAGPRVHGLLWFSALFNRWPERLTVMGCSEYVARSFRRAPFYRKMRVESCLNPVQTPPANLHRPRLLEPEQRVRLGMVARLDPIKDHATLLRAFALVRTQWVRAELHLAGAGPLQGELEALALDLGVSAAVRFHGSVGDVPAFLQTLDLFCYLTTAHEGMGIALAEAMAAGLPCVVNDLPVMREVAGDPAEHAACLVPAEPAALSRAIDGLLRDEAERTRLSAGGWRRARAAFAPRRTIDRYLEVLEVMP